VNPFNGIESQGPMYSVSFGCLSLRIHSMELKGISYSRVWDETPDNMNPFNGIERL